MLRVVLSALCVFGVVGLVSAEEKKDDRTVAGKFKDYKDGKLTILVGKPGEEKEQTFDIKADIKVAVLDGTEKRELAAKEAFNKDLNKILKDGTPVRVRLDAEKKVESIEMGARKK